MYWPRWPPLSSRHIILQKFSDSARIHEAQWDHSLPSVHPLNSPWHVCFVLSPGDSYLEDYVSFLLLQSCDLYLNHGRYLVTIWWIAEYSSQSALTVAIKDIQPQWCSKRHCLWKWDANRICSNGKMVMKESNEGSSKNKSLICIIQTDYLETSSIRKLFVKMYLEI